MDGYAGVSDRLDRTLSVLRRTLEAMFYATLIVALVGMIVLVGAGVFGVLHNGDDFDIGGPANGSGGDIIVPGVLR